MLIFTGRFQPFHKGHLYVIRKLQKDYPNEIVCLAVIKDVLIGKKSEFDKTVDEMLTQERNPFNSEITLSLIEKVLKTENINNTVVTLMPRASQTTWEMITELFDCKRVWVFTKNIAEKDEWEERKSEFYKSMDDEVVRVPIVKDINGSEIRQSISSRDFKTLERLVPKDVNDFLKEYYS